MSIVPRAQYNKSLLVIYNIYVYVNPKLLIYPSPTSPLLTISLFSISTCHFFLSRIILLVLYLEAHHQIKAHLDLLCVIFQDFYI